ncbi:MAG: hypothetical protein ACO1SX_11000 [Actinomycetota bacterium]
MGQALNLSRTLLEGEAADEIFLFGCQLERGAPRMALGFLVSLEQLPGPSLKMGSLTPEWGGELGDAAEITVGAFEGGEAPDTVTMGGWSGVRLAAALPTSADADGTEQVLLRDDDQTA